MNRRFWSLMLTGVAVTAIAGSSWGQSVGVQGPGVQVHGNTGVYSGQPGVYVQGNSGYYGNNGYYGNYGNTGYYQSGHYGSSYHSGGYYGSGHYGNAACCPDAGVYVEADYDDDCDD